MYSKCVYVRLEGSVVIFAVFEVGVQKQHRGDRQLYIPIIKQVTAKSELVAVLLNLPKAHTVAPKHHVETNS